MGEPIRVLVVQGHALMRQAVAQRLEASGAVVVGKAQTNAEAVVEYAQRHPDVVIVDGRLGGESGCVLITDLLECYPDAVVVVYSGLDVQLVNQAVEAGAAGYVCRDASRAELQDCLRLALRGVRPVLDRRITSRRSGCSAEANGSVARPRQLTARQQEVLELMAAGTTSNKDIARRLFISEKTVKSHIERIAASLDVSRRTQLALRALELGLIAATDQTPAGLDTHRADATIGTSGRRALLTGARGPSVRRHRHPPAPGTELANA